MTGLDLTSPTFDTNRRFVKECQANKPKGASLTNLKQTKGLLGLSVSQI